MRTALALVAAAVAGAGLATWLDDHPATIAPPIATTVTQCWIDVAGMWCETYPPQPAGSLGDGFPGETRP